MEQKMIKVPFDVEMAKKITNGEVEGKIVTRDYKSVRIVCFDAKQDDPIVALISCDNAERVKSYAKDGIVFEAGTSPNDLMLKIPEYMSFKDGDVIAFGNFDDALNIAIFEKRIAETNHKGYVSLGYYSGTLTYDYNGFTLNNARFATEEEKRKLIDTLKVNREPKAKKYLKRFFGIEVEDKYSKYKDGDILRAYDCIVIIKNPLIEEGGKFAFEQYAGFSCNSNKLIDCDLYYKQEAVRYANDKEKETIKRAMQESGNPYYDDILKKYFGIEQKQEYEFKPFDRVICRDDYSEWFVDMFSHIDGNGSFACIGSVWKYCLPYNEQTAHLLGTEKDYKED